MPAPDISVIIPTKNRHGLLNVAVGSVLIQSLPLREIIVVDDGKDASAAVSGLSPLLRVIDNGMRGPVQARNLGVAAATGSLIAFLDDDDWLIDRDCFREAAEAVAAGSDLIFCDGIMKFENGDADEFFAFDADAQSLEANNTILISGVVYRRALHDRLGRFDESLPYYWDWDWYLRVARAGFRLKRQVGPAVAIRVHSENMSGAEQQASRRENLDRFAAKHSLPSIPLKNHVSLAREARDG